MKSTRQITSAMKMVSAAKLRKAQDKIVRVRPYANKLHEILLNLSQSLADLEITDVYSRAWAPDKILIVIITSNRGLCGALLTEADAAAAGATRGSAPGRGRADLRTRGATP